MPTKPTHAQLLLRQTKGHKVQLPILPDAEEPGITNDAYALARCLVGHDARFQISRPQIKAETGLSQRRLAAALRHLTAHNYIRPVVQRRGGRLDGACFAFSPDGEADKLPKVVLHYSVTEDRRKTTNQSKKRQQMRRKICLGNELHYRDRAEDGTVLLEPDNTVEERAITPAPEPTPVIAAEARVADADPLYPYYPSLPAKPAPATTSELPATSKTASKATSALNSPRTTSKAPSTATCTSPSPPTRRER